MEPNRRFTILTFPQFFDGNVLKVNVVFLPRNQNPLQGAIEGAPPSPMRRHLPMPSSPSWQRSSPGLQDFPKTYGPPSTDVTLTTA